MSLPCRHLDETTRQVLPTINLLENMDELHPDILLQHDIQPVDYHGSLVFRSAIESIRGTYIASSTTGREGMVRDILESLLRRSSIAGYEQQSSKNRYDFEIAIEHNPDYFVALEVKGGEGNSINISDRPIWAREFCIWSHLDGAIKNQPAKGAHSVINRLANDLVRRKKKVDVLFFKDILCGTRVRPCPKYPDEMESIGIRAAPDVFLFPQRVPSAADPDPPVHTLETLRLPRLILDHFGIAEVSKAQHIWEVHVSIEERANGQLCRLTQIRQAGKIVDESRSRSWKPNA